MKNTLPYGMTERDVERFWSKVARRGRDECWLWQAGQRRGYGRIRVGERLIGAHQIAWALAKGPVPRGKCVLHNCPGEDNRACCNPMHLWIGTKGDNNADKIAKGRQSSGASHSEIMRRVARRGASAMRLPRPAIRMGGEGNPKAKLSREDVLEIRRLYATGRYRQVDLAQTKGIKQITVSNIVTRKTWNHLPPEEG